MKSILLSTLLLIVSLPILAQSGYITTKNEIVSGLTFIKPKQGEKSTLLLVQEKNRIVRYTPDQILGYGFKNGPSFKSKEVKINGQVQMLFIEEIVTGNANLYTAVSTDLETQYFISKGEDSETILLPNEEKELKAFLIQYFENCPVTLQNIPYVKPNKASLKRIVSDYHHCAASPFPRIKYGVNAGLAAKKFSRLDDIILTASPEFSYSPTVTGGINLDLPIKSSNFSFNTGVYYTSHSLKEEFSHFNYHFRFNSKYTSLNIPLILRYSHLKGKHTPYVQTGLIYSKLFNAKSEMFYKKTDETNPEYKEVDAQILSKNQAGGTIGAGVIFSYNSKLSYFTELKFNRLGKISGPTESAHINEIFFTVGILL